MWRNQFRRKKNLNTIARSQDQLADQDQIFALLQRLQMKVSQYRCQNHLFFQHSVFLTYTRPNESHVNQQEKRFFVSSSRHDKYVVTMTCGGRGFIFYGDFFYKRKMCFMKNHHFKAESENDKMESENAPRSPMQLRGPALNGTYA